jgi:hypothetical protein
MGEHNSPYFAAGREDGRADADLVSMCPPAEPAGMNAEREWSIMYRRGYGSTFLPVPCPCDGSCRVGKQYGEAPQGAKTGG